jgi:hypothetical protein
MTQPDEVPVTLKPKMELKVKAAGYATFFVSLAVFTFLSTTATDYVKALPDALESVGLAAVVAASTFVAGYVKKSRPASLAQSTIDAASVWLAKRMPRGPVV